MKRSSVILLVLICMVALLYLPVHSQSKENGAIVGKVTSSDGQLLPGVEISVSSPSLIGGKRVSITNVEGKYRFVALLPGIYELTAQLDGFKSSIKKNLQLTIGSTLTVDVAMQLGQITETIEVAGVPALIDVKDSQVGKTNLSNTILENIPNNQFVTEIVNMAPGIDQYSAFGSSDYGVQYQIDGVDVTDPDLGSAYYFIDYGVVEEVNIMGIGAPAEYGGFTGIIANTVTKSGSNTLQGMLDTFMQAKKWNSENSDDPGLLSPNSEIYNVHLSLGGPLKEDKLWFFVGSQYYVDSYQAPGFTGGPTKYKMPRIFLKLTWQMNKDSRFSAFVEYDTYNGVNRWADVYTLPEATFNQDGPGLMLNMSYLHIFSDYTFLEAKFAGFYSYWRWFPASGDKTTPGHYDYPSYMWTENAYSYKDNYRNHLQLNTSVSHHADDFIKGSHDFKFGIEVEYNPTRTEYRYTGGVLYYDYYNYPYAAYSWEGYDNSFRNTRISLYAQDSWDVSNRLKINAGVRLNYYRGKIEGVGTVFKPELAIAPRFGITFDVFGDHSTALKFHYGKYYENIINVFYNSMQPNSDYISSYYNWDTGEYEEWYRDVLGPEAYSMDDNIRMPYMHQFTIGIEREIAKDLSLSINYIYRSNHDYIDRVNLTGVFEPMSYIDPDSGKEYTVYNQVNLGENQYIITNPKEGDYPIVAFTPSLKYSGLEIVLNKRFSNKWQVLASYVYSKAKGTNDNMGWGDSSGARSSVSGTSSLFSDPNYQINAEGTPTIDPTHMLKVQASVVLPFDITLAAYYSYITGNSYNKFLSVSLDQGRTRILADKFGSMYRYPARKNLDLRLAKTFTFNKLKIGFILDAFNVLNADTITGVQTGSIDFQSVDGLVTPRRFRAGIRVNF